MTSGLQCLKVFVAVAAVFAVATQGFPTNTRCKDVWLLKSVLPGVSPYVLMPENTISYSQSFSITKVVRSYWAIETMDIHITHKKLSECHSDL